MTDFILKAITEWLVKDHCPHGNTTECTKFVSCMFAFVIAFLVIVYWCTREKRSIAPQEKFGGYGAARRLLQNNDHPIIPTSDQDEFGAITARRLLQKKDRPINPRLNQNQYVGVRRLLRNNRRPRMRIRQN